MKLLICVECGDVRKLHRHRTYCECGKVWGEYLSDGAHAVVSPTAGVVGLSNTTLRQAIHAQDHPDAGYRTLAAWLMGKDAPRVRWAEHQEEDAPAVVVATPDPVYVVLETEHDTEFPGVVLGVYMNKAAAEAHVAARIAQWEREHDENYADADINIFWEEHTITNTFTGL